MGMRRVVVALLIVFAVGVGATGTSAEKQPPPLRQQREASKALVSATDEYLAVAPPVNQQDPASWVDFYDRADVLLADVRGAYGEWVLVVDRALKSSAVRKSDKRLLRRYRSAEDAWIMAQEEQARLSRSCVTGSPTLTDSGTCLNAMVAEHGTRWNQIASKLNRLQRRVDAQL